MAVTFVTGGNRDSSGSTIPAASSTTQVNDFALIALTSGIAVTTPAGWTLLMSNTTTRFFYVWSKRLTVANETFPSLTVNSNARYMYAVLRGVGETNIFNSAVATSTSPTCPAVTTTKNDAWLINFFLTTVGGGAVTWTTPASGTNRNLATINASIAGGILNTQVTTTAGSQAALGSTLSTSLFNGGYRIALAPDIAPVISSITTPAFAGDTVTISGTDFTTASSVTFGALSASFTVVNSTTITAIVPDNGNAGGTVTVTVTNLVGSGTVSFTYIQYFAPYQYEKITGFKTTDTNTNQTQDLGSRYITKDYLLDVYPNIASVTGTITSPGLWTWGQNTYGQLGLLNVTNRSSPVQVGTLTNWKSTASGAYHTAAIKTDGTLWTWGQNGFGNLGLLNIVHRSSPVQVGSLTNWKQVSCGLYHTAAIKTDGTLWTWGRNLNGQLGLLDAAHRSSPVQVGSLTNWKIVAGGGYHTAAIKTDGTLWTWGHNNNGQLGLLNVTNRSSPVQVGLLNNWKQVSCGSYTTTAIKTDGTLWTWGYNLVGGLGLLDIAHRSSPVQVGSLTNWKLVSGGFYHTAAIKTNGTLWLWGQNTNGGLGLLDVTNRSSPVQVGSLTNWKQVSGGYYHTEAISDGSY